MDMMKCVAYKGKCIPCSKCRYENKAGCYLRNLEEMLNMKIIAEGCTKGDYKNE